MNRLWKKFLLCIAIPAVWLGCYAGSVYLQDKLWAEFFAVLVHIPILSLLPLVISPWLGSLAEKELSAFQQLMSCDAVLFAAVFFLLCIPTLPFYDFWSIKKLCAVILLPAVLSAVTFWLGVFRSWFARAFSDSPYVLALRQIKGIWIYFLCALSYETVSVLFKHLNYFSDEPSWLFAFGYTPLSWLLHPIVCCVLGILLKRNTGISTEKGLCFGILVFILFIGVKLVNLIPYLLLGADSIRFYVLDIWWIWTVPPACTALAFTAPLLMNRKRI